VPESCVQIDAKTFWDFSVSWYGRKGVASLCLSLQDVHHLNVNMVLLLAWCTQQQVLIDAEAWSQIAMAIHPTDLRLKQHRHQRKMAKAMQGAASDMYASLKEQELILEQMQQAQMLDILKQIPLQPEAHRMRIIDAFLAHAKPEENARVRLLLEAISNGRHSASLA